MSQTWITKIYKLKKEEEKSNHIKTDSVVWNFFAGEILKLIGKENRTSWVF